MVGEAGVRQKLSRDLIVAAARGLADTAGLDALTLRELAQELGTGQASLYRHIADRRELLSLLADDVARGFPQGDPDLPLPQRLVQVWLDTYAYLSRHRWAARVITDGDLVSPNAVPFAERQLAYLAEAGLSPSDAMHAYRTLFNLLLGYLLNQHPMGHHREGGHDTPGPTDDDGFAWAVRRFVSSFTETREA